jgi:hypothetical protein
MPFRVKNIAKKKYKFLISSLVGLLLFISIGLLGYFTNGFALQRYDSNELMTHKDFLRSGTFKKLGDINAKANWILLGDSHADSLQEGLSELLVKYKQSSIIGTIPGCPPSLNLWRHDMDYKMKCHDNYTKALNDIQENHIKNVLISARFAIYINSDRFDNTIGGVEKGKTKKVIYDHLEYKDFIRPKKERVKAIEYELVEYIRKLVNIGANVFVISSIPEFGWDVPERFRLNQKTNIPRKIYNLRVKPLNSFYKKISDFENVSILHSDKVFCNENECSAIKGGKLLFYDSNHPSIFGAKELLNHFEGELMHIKK